MPHLTSVDRFEGGPVVWSKAFLAARGACQEASAPSCSFPLSTRTVLPLGGTLTCVFGWSRPTLQAARLPVYMEGLAHWHLPEGDSRT